MLDWTVNTQPAIGETSCSNRRDALPVTRLTTDGYCLEAHLVRVAGISSATMASDPQSTGDSMPMSELKYLDLHGDQVAYRDVGSGPETLLLLHGMAGSSETWRAVLPQLAKRYRVIAPDLLGHGQSAKPRSDYSLGAFAVSLRDLLDELGVARVTVVGQSLGGGVTDVGGILQVKV